MQPLIDGDILLHEIGWSGEFKDKETKEEILLPTEHVFDLLDKKIQGICHDVEADAPPIIFFSDSEWLAKKQGREYVKGFRYDIAKTKPYKGNRLNPKPFHFYNLLVYMLAEYNCQIATDGEEADDLICYTQVLSTSSQTTTIICSRDKDVRIAPGWHFSWECGDQRAIGPIFTDANGWLEKEKMVIRLDMALPSSTTKCLLEIVLTTSPDSPNSERRKRTTYLVELKPPTTSLQS